ncbi:Cell division control protein 11 [Basidiobolus ranarum]|uniref:Cell division control protein 11 n=1 Tax=Basidiobolus ranarum TaxID=34480 RepID=A0ABR2X1M9_9FUNG
MARSLSTRRRNQPTPFNIMVVGNTGLGKTTFIDTCIKSLELDGQYINNRDKIDSPLYDSTKDIITRKVTTTNQGLRLALNFLDTPGLVANGTLNAQYELILDYIKSLLFLRLQEETRLKRSTRPKEEQVHVCLFFVQPNKVRVSETELTFAKSLSRYVNIIPVIGKADTCTVSELRQVKSVVQRDFRNNDIPIFDFPDEEEEEEEKYHQNQELRLLLPFALVSSEEIRPKGPEGTNVLGREYSWGVVECFNPNHSDMAYLKRALLETHLHILKELTYLRLYEDYRTEQLLNDLKHKSIEYSRERDVRSSKKIQAKPLDGEIIESKLDASFDSGFSWDSTSQNINPESFHHVDTSVLPDICQLTNQPHESHQSSPSCCTDLLKSYGTSSSKSKSLLHHNNDPPTHLEKSNQVGQGRHKSLPVLTFKIPESLPTDQEEPVRPGAKNEPALNPQKIKRNAKRRISNCVM